MASSTTNQYLLDPTKWSMSWPPKRVPGSMIDMCYCNDINGEKPNIRVGFKGKSSRVIVDPSVFDAKAREEAVNQLPKVGTTFHLADIAAGTVKDKTTIKFNLTQEDFEYFQGLDQWAYNKLEGQSWESEELKSKTLSNFKPIASVYDGRPQVRVKYHNVPSKAMPEGTSTVKQIGKTMEVCEADAADLVRAAPTFLNLKCGGVYFRGDECGLKLDATAIRIITGEESSAPSGQSGFDFGGDMDVDPVEGDAPTTPYAGPGAPVVEGVELDGEEVHDDGEGGLELPDPDDTTVVGEGAQF